MRKGIFLIFVFWALLDVPTIADIRSFQTTEAHHKLGKFEIVIVQKALRVISSRGDVIVGAWPHACSASVEIKKKVRTIDKLDFDIRPTGGRYGLFLPKRQESPRHFILVKLGDYDPKVIVITDKGRRFVLGGSAYRVFRGRYLIAQGDLAADAPYFTIFDLMKDKILLTIDWDSRVARVTGPPLPPSQAYLIKLYSRGPELFAMVDMVEFSTSKTFGHEGHVYRIDLNAGDILDAASDEKGLDEFPIDDSNIDVIDNCLCRETSVRIVPPDP